MKKTLSKIFLSLSIVSFIGMIVSMVFYFINKNKVNSIEFIEIALNSIREADKLMNFTTAMGYVTIILAVLTVILAGVTVVFFLLNARDKKSNVNNTGNIDLNNPYR